MNRGVAGVSFTSSLNGTIEGRAGVFGTASLSLPLTLAPEGANGGGIRSPSPGAGSLKTAIRDVDAAVAGADVTRCCGPGCRSVVPFSLDTFGTFPLCVLSVSPIHSKGLPPYLRLRGLRL